MELTVDRSRLFARLKRHLEEMNRCAANLEEIMVMEQEAIRRFDGEALLDLCDLRADCHAKMAELESSCRRVLRENGAPDEMSLSEFLAAGGADDELRALRRNLYHRMLSLQKGIEEEQLRAKAAADVTHNLLQSVGMIRHPQTYRPGGAK